MKNKREIAVGDCIDIAWWKLGKKLWYSWREDDEEYKDLMKRLNPKEEILPAGEYTLEIDYPLNTPFIHKKEFKTPITREQIVKWIVDGYHFIYAVEDETSQSEASLISGMLNRNITDGKYGIWGHSIEDLALHTIYVDENNVITVGIDS